MLTEIVDTRRVGLMTVHVTDYLPRPTTATGCTCALDPHSMVLHILETASIPRVLAEIEATTHPIYSNLARGALGLPPWPARLGHLRGITVASWMGLALT